MKLDPHWLVDGPRRAAQTLVLAHGAGAAMDTDFMQAITQPIAAAGIRVIRFEFPYMAAQRETGQKRPPDRAPVLRAAWLSVIEQVQASRLSIGGKSMGGRIASLIADEAQAERLVCLGYPFHPTGQPDRLRIDHLRDLQTPALILQGERDPMGNRGEVEGYDLPSRIKVRWLLDGDHSFAPRKSSGRTAQENWRQAAEEVIAFLHSDD